VMIGLNNSVNKTIKSYACLSVRIKFYLCLRKILSYCKFNLMLYSLLKTSLGRLRIVAVLEGISLLVLIGIAMPIKYMAGNPQPVRIVGMAHGVLFILYVLMLIQVAIERNWSWKKAILAFIASFIPFGTFYADAKWFRE